MTPSRRLLLALLALVALALGACSDDGDGESSSPTTEAPAGDHDDDDEGGGEDGCDVVTAADARDLLGEAVVKDVPSAPTPGQVVSECVWGAQDESSFGLVQYRVWDGPEYFTPDAFQDTEGFQEVDDLGDGAYFTTLTGVDLAVLVGDRTVTLNVSSKGPGSSDGAGADAGAVRDKLRTLAERVVEEIG